MGIIDAGSTFINKHGEKLHCGWKAHEALMNMEDHHVVIQVQLSLRQMQLNTLIYLKNIYKDSHDS